MDIKPLSIKITPRPATPRAKVRITRDSLAPLAPTLRVCPRGAPPGRQVSLTPYWRKP